ncbi:MAG: hypothetical protein ACREPX_03990 [Rhodanobacteraceae bacterium]
MIDVVALLLAVSISGTTDVVFNSGFDGDTCPSGRITRSNISYGSGGTRSNVDLTQFENIWGRAGSSDPISILWPGYPGTSPIIQDFTRDGFVAAKFHTPIVLLPTLNGFYKSPSYPGGPNIDFSISEQCADFNPPQSGCLATNVPQGDTPLIYWRTTQGAFFCILEPDTDYFVNIRLTDPDAVDPNCDDDENTCLVHTLNYFGGD